ncbi:MAG: hypothetical protein M3N13_09240 [Candidatus Eremiobacteraeota bacterium]|nr:hypothetical protein [Candidatus Eremiobacteraeota bacterium]
MSLKPMPNRQSLVRSTLLGMIPLAFLAYLLAFEFKFTLTDPMARIFLVIAVFAAIVGIGFFVAAFLKRPSSH